MRLSPVFSLIRKFFHNGGKVLIIAAIFAPTSFIALSIYRAKLNHNAQTTICQKIHILDVGIQTILLGSIPTRESLNKITYYRMHPTERDSQIRESERFVLFQIKHTLIPADCPPQ